MSIISHNYCTNTLYELVSNIYHRNHDNMDTSNIMLLDENRRSSDNNIEITIHDNNNYDNNNDDDLNILYTADNTVDTTNYI